LSTSAAAKLAINTKLTDVDDDLPPGGGVLGVLPPAPDASVPVGSVTVVLEPVESVTVVLVSLGSVTAVLVVVATGVVKTVVAVEVISDMEISVTSVGVVNSPVAVKSVPVTVVSPCTLIMARHNARQKIINRDISVILSVCCSNYWTREILKTFLFIDLDAFIKLAHGL